MVTIRCCPPQPPVDLLQLQILPAQQPFVLPIADILQQQRQGEHFHLLYQQQQLIGFFMLDIEYVRFHSFAQPYDLGLRGFFIDVKAQGNGYAKSALNQLPGYVQQHYPTARRLVLTVNCRNAAARQLYLATGFQDSGTMFHGGPSGPQHVMWQTIQSIQR